MYNYVNIGSLANRCISHLSLNSDTYENMYTHAHNIIY